MKDFGFLGQPRTNLSYDFNDLFISGDHASNYEFVESWDIEAGQDVEIGPDGNIYASGGPIISIYDLNGALIDQWEDVTYISDVNGFVFDSQSNLFGVDGISQQVFKLDSQGNFILAWGSEGKDNGQFMAASRIVCDSNDNIYVADNGLWPHRIQKFDTNGNFIKSWNLPYGSGSGVLGLGIDSKDFIYVAGDYFLKYDPNGGFIKEWETPITIDGRLDGPTDIAFDSSDALYLTEFYWSEENKGRIQKFDSEGNFITSFSTDGRPHGITVASNGLVYVLDEMQGQIQIYAPIADTINIENNNSFISHGFHGSGTSNDPFIISGYSITCIASSPISIQNTDAYFIIRDNQFFGVSKSHPGIYLQNVTNCMIINNTITDCQDGITLERVNHISISNNTISNSLGAGIWLSTDSHSNSLSNNLLFNNWNGIEIGSDLTSCHDNTISNNSCHSNENSGISIYSSSHNILYCNNIYENSIGIELDSSSHNTFFHNTIQNNENWGIQISSTSNENDIEQNNFVDNQYTWSSISQASDSGTLNLFVNNFWSDWKTHPDENGDGIIDDPYLIEGSASNEDPYPMKHIISVYDFLSPIIILFPKNGDILFDKVTINWITAPYFPTYGITYSLYYTNQENGSWILLSSNLTVTYYHWNTITVNDGSNYRLKLVVENLNGSTFTVISEGTFAIKNSYIFLSTLIIPIALAILSLVVLFLINRQLSSVLNKFEER